MDRKIELTKGDLLFLALIFALGGIFSILWMALTGNSPQAYNDIVVEWTTWVRSNKGTEILLLRMLILLGSAAIVCRLLLKGRKAGDIDDSGKAAKIAGESMLLLACTISLFVLKMLFMQSFSKLMLAAVFFMALAYVLDKKAVGSTFCLFFISYYTFFAYYHLLRCMDSFNPVAHNDMDWSVPSSHALVFAICCTALSMPFKNRRLIQKRAALVMQLALPFLYNILSIQNYSYLGQKEWIWITPEARLFMVLAVFLSLADAARTLKGTWKAEELDPSSYISLGSCIAIMCFNFYCGEGAVVNPDMHHPYENVFAFQQVFELGQIPFRDFIPPAGLYSIVQGAFFKLFGKGQMAYYALANNIFYYTVIALTLFLLKLHLGKTGCFALALLIQIPDYNRVAFMTPIVLLLLLPALIRRPNLWLKVFLLVSVFHGLYYPVYAVACFAGFIPLAVIQARKIAADPEKPYSRTGFWMGWLPVILLLLASVPLLWGTLLHIKAMAGQSMLADGISFFGQQLPDWFMPYAGSAIRYPLYTIMQVVPLAMTVWLPVLFLCSFLHKGGDTAASMMGKNIEMFTMILSLAMIPAVSYTFSFIRLDLFTLFVRSWPALVCVIFLHAVFAYKYLKDNTARLIVLILLGIIIVPASGIGVDHARGKMFSQIKVPENYHRVENVWSQATGWPNTTGKCFIEKNVSDKLALYEKYAAVEKTGNSSFALFESFGYWYAYSLKGAANIEGGVMKGFGAASETRKMLLANRASVGTVDPLETYYLYNWLICSGEYRWDKDFEIFLPCGEKAGIDDLRRYNLSSPLFKEDYELGNSADVFGLSFDKLKKIFTEKELSFGIIGGKDGPLDIMLSEPVPGKEMDFLYIELDGLHDKYEWTEFGIAGEQKKDLPPLLSRLFLKKKPNPSMKVEVTFYGEDGRPHHILANYGNGRLLLNLGVGCGYLLEKHDKLEITLLRDGQPVPAPAPKEIKFLKCRTIYE